MNLFKPCIRDMTTYVSSHEDHFESIHKSRLWASQTGAQGGAQPGALARAGGRSEARWGDGRWARP